MSKKCFCLILLVLSLFTTGLTMNAHGSGASQMALQAVAADRDVVEETTVVTEEIRLTEAPETEIFTLNTTDETEIENDGDKMSAIKVRTLEYTTTAANLVNADKLRMKGEHEVAAFVYEYLSDLGWSDASIAGVLGNMMAECGGQTLELQARIYDPSGMYYGLCQWSSSFHSKVIGRDTEGQLEYLTESLDCQMKYFGGSAEEFFAITDASSAARYFCNYYERGAGVNQRASNAAVALEWILEVSC